MNHAGLDDDVVALDVDDLTDDAADGRDLIAHAQAFAHLSHGLLLLVLRPDQQEIEDTDHDSEH